MKQLITAIALSVAVAGVFAADAAASKPLTAQQQNRAVWMVGYYFAPATATGARLLLYPGSLPFP